MNTPSKIQAEIERKRNAHLLQLADAGQTPDQLVAQFGLARPEVDKLIFAHRQQRANGAAQTYARAVNAGAECVWAMPASDNMAAMSSELARVAVELQNTVAQYADLGNRVMVCVAILPPDEPIKMRAL